jgi:hypothetical protein
MIDQLTYIKYVNAIKLYQESEHLMITEMTSADIKKRLLFASITDKPPKCDYCDKLGPLLQACCTKIIADITKERTD